MFTGGTQRIKIPPEQIRRWLDRNFPSAKTRKGAKEYVVCNPLKQQDQPRLNINVETGKCHDWTGDEWAGAPNPKTGKRACHITRLIQLIRGCSYREAIKELMGDCPYSYEAVESKHDQTETPIGYHKVQIPTGYMPLVGPNDFFSNRVWNYLLKRGYIPEQILKENIHFLGANALWLYTEFGELVYLQSREVISKRFWFPPNEIVDASGNVVSKLEVTKEDVLYGFDDVPKSNYVIITESIFNKVSLGNHCVATGGAAMTEGQVKRLKFLNPELGVILAPDNDKPGLESVLTNGDLLLSRGFKVFWSVPPRIPIGSDKYIKDWNELHTELSFNHDKIIETMNKTLIPYNDASRFRIRSVLALGIKKNQRSTGFFLS